MALLPREKKRSEVFVCDNCGLRKRLPSDKRHWCDNCTTGSPIEMRRANDKRLNFGRVRPTEAPSAPAPTRERTW
ncbi:MAG: hypothetical protein M3128_02495 [Verrucomicrobiota bacterium]|nr:hypothetical protein [Verrucomicrobiota bacterium]